MRIVCNQMILMKYHDFFIIFEKAAKFEIVVCCKLWVAFYGLISLSYIMGCPPERRDIPRALASGLSYVQVDKHGITTLYHLHQYRPCISRYISC